MIDKIISEDVENISSSYDPSFFEDKKVLITGGAGFLGSYLCDVLVKLGSNIVCLDNFSSGVYSNIAHLYDRANFNLIKMDVSNIEINGNFDYIFHLASRASPEDYQLHPVETLTANSIGTFKILNLTLKGNSKVVYASSSEVYGDPKEVPTSEDYWGNVNPIGVRSCYDEGKRYGEALCMAYFREYASNIRIVRIHNTYGPRIRYDGPYARALPRFISQALGNKDITVYGDGSQTRSFCYVTDTIKGILTSVISEHTNGEVINIGNSYEISILNLAKKIKALCNSKSLITFKKLPEDDPKRRKPNLGKALKMLNWKPRIELDDGLFRTIEWYKFHDHIL